MTFNILITKNSIESMFIVMRIKYTEKNSRYQSGSNRKPSKEKQMRLKLKYIKIRGYIGSSDVVCTLYYNGGQDCAKKLYFGLRGQY